MTSKRLSRESMKINRAQMDTVITNDTELNDPTASNS